MSKRTNSKGRRRGGLNSASINEATRLRRRPKRAATRSQLAIELLEERRLLAADIESAISLAASDVAEIRAALASGTATKASIADSLTGSRLVDAGDFYWADGQRIPLWRVTDEFVLQFGNSTAQAGLSRQGGPLAGFQASARMGNNLVSFKASQPVTEQTLAALDTQGGVAWAGRAFVDSVSGSRVWESNEVIVALKPGVSAASFFSTQYAYRPLVGTPDQFVVTVVGGPEAVLNQANAWNFASGVAFAAPNFYHQLSMQALVPNDPLFGEQWHHNNTGQTGARTDADSDLTDAWSSSTGSNVVIAIVDSGLQLNHPDLAANIFVNTGEITGNNIDDDGNGWIDDVSGWDFLDDDNNPSPTDPDDNHATAVSGVAAAVGNNGIGVTGVAFNAKILPVRIGSGEGFTSDAAIASAIYYAAGRTADGLDTWRGADVQNHSWGGGAPASAVIAAFDWAAINARDGKGSLTFVASGNSASGYMAPTDLAAVLGPGAYVFEWRYSKDATIDDGDDTAWLANIHLPDGTVERFDTPGLPTGWSASGATAWSVVDDPAHAYGTGRYVAKAGDITHGQTTTLRSRPITVTGSGSLSFDAWVSSEYEADGLSLFVSTNGGATFSGALQLIAFDPFFGSTFTTLQSGDASFFVDEQVGYPAHLDSVFAVGSSTDWDYRADYSQYGAALDFVAPSGGGNADLFTTDRTGTAGYDNSNYTSIAGTSFSAPVAAGIAALLLSKDPTLTLSQVRTILQNSADKVGGVTYTNGFNTYYGYGRLNAATALNSPEMNLSSGGVPIADGDTSPTAIDGTNFGTVNVAGAVSTHTFTISNTGPLPLNLTGSPRVQITGANAGDFTVVAQPSASVAARSSISFQIAFNPSAGGVRTASVSIVNNDSNEGPYNFSISGTGGTEPEIDVRGNGVSIPDGDTTPSTTDFTDFGPLDVAASAVKRTFTIANVGSVALSLIGSPRVQITGANASDFSVVAQPAASVAAGGSLTFQLSFNASAAGLRTAKISIPSNDGNETPYDFVVRGTGTTAPDIDVRGNGVSIPDGDTTPSTTDFTDFGSLDVAASAVTRTFTIANTGSAALSLIGSPRVQITGANASDFSVVAQPAASIAGGGSLTFQLSFNASAAGLRTAKISIPSNDGNETPYDFIVRGTGTGPPEIDVKGNSISIADGDITPTAADFTDFGTLDVAASPVLRTFTIVNAGSGPLNLSGSPRVSISGAHAADFSVVVQPAASVAAGGSTTFQISFNASATGIRTANLSIANNDANENPFNFVVQGTGTAAPEIDLRGSGLSILTGDAIPSITDGTDFGVVDLTSGSVTHVFAIHNLGSGTLNLSGSPRVQMSGLNPGDFTVSTQPSATVAVGSSTTFEIVFNPTASGSRSATVNIANDDGNENSYVFTIQGWGSSVVADIGDTLATAASTGLTSAGGTATGGNPIGNGSFGNKDVDVYSFQAAAGNVVTARTTRPASGTAMDTYLRLFNSAGVQLASNDDASAQTLYSQITNFSIASAGTYYVAVSGYGNSTYNSTVGGSGRAGNIGSYDLSVVLNPVAALSAGNNLQTRASTSFNMGAGLQSLGGSPRTLVNETSAGDSSVVRTASLLPSAALQSSSNFTTSGLRSSTIPVDDNIDQESTSLNILPSHPSAPYASDAPLFTVRRAVSPRAIDAIYAELGDAESEGLLFSGRAPLGIRLGS